MKRTLLQQEAILFLRLFSTFLSGQSKILSEKISQLYCWVSQFTYLFISGITVYILKNGQLRTQPAVFFCEYLQFIHILPRG